MNKKLFSWKALAGFALLVAMGLTSCQQTTEVDPNDPTGAKKPTQPSTSTKGSADLTFTIKAAGDLNTLWNDWKKNNADAAKKLDDKSTINIDVNFKDFEIVKGQTIVVPQFFNKPADKTVNISFNGNFKNADKEMLGLDVVSNLPGANVNVKLPAQTFSLNFNASTGAATTRPVLTSDGATLTTLTGSFPAGAKNLLTIGDGVTVKVLDDVANDVKVSGTGAIEAVKLTAGTWTGEDDGTIKKNGQKFANLEIAGNVTVKGKGGDKKLKLANVHISGANTLTIDTNVASIDNISGDLTAAKALQAKVVADAIVGKLSKVILSAKTAATAPAVTTVEIKDGSVLDNVEITDEVKASANIGSVAGVIFDKQVTINFDKNNVAFAFNGVQFKLAKNAIKVEGKVESETVNTYATYKYSVATGWSKVADDPSVPVNADIASFSGGKFYKADKTTEVIPSEDVVRFKTGSETLTTLPENTSITLDAATVNVNKINGSNVTDLFGGVHSIDPGYSVILNDTKYIWKKTDDPTATTYALRKA